MTARASTLLRVQNLYVRFGGLAAVQDFSCGIEEGEIVSVIGPNGAGKTTTVNAITGFVPPTSGSVYLRENNIAGARPEKIASLGLIRTFQNAAMFASMSVADNLATGYFLADRSSFWQTVLRTPALRREKRAERKRLEEVLDLIGLSSRRDVIARDLPYGDQRVLGVGIALMADPMLLLLDEPAAGLSPEEARQIGNLIRTIRDAGISILLIEHNMSLVMSVAHRILVLQQGCLLAEGTPTEIRNHPEVVKAYLGAEP